jgi:ribosomal protein S18 acetylase RimI-like enzyme
MSQTPYVEFVRTITSDVIAYLEKDVTRNALDLWYLHNGDKRYELRVCRIKDDVRAHLGTYDTPEAIYSSLGGEPEAAVALLNLIPSKTALTTSKDLGDLVTNNLKHNSTYANDIMVVGREEVKLKNPDLAIRLSPDHLIQYSAFGSSFNVTNVPMEWVQECLERDIIFGVFLGDELVSVASLVGRHPQVSVILGVETKPEFRNRGFGAIVVSAAVLEGLRLSNSCSLFVRVDNVYAISLYKALGFKKVGEELWIDIGTGIIP